MTAWLSATDWMGITHMRINNLGYLIKEGIRGIFLHGFMSFAAVCVTVACLLIVGTFSALVYNVNLMVEDLNKTNEVIVYVDSQLPVSEAKSVETKVRRIDNILGTSFISREEALENFAQDLNESDALDGVVAEDLNYRIVVTLEDNALMRQTVDQLREIPGVTEVSASFELAEAFSTIQQVLEIASVAVIAGLLLVSLLIISNTVKLAMYDRRDEIAIMKMVGATNGFIRLPFIVEGFALGMVGAAIAFALEWVMYDTIMLEIEKVDTLSKLLTIAPFDELLIPMVAIFAGAGLFVGIVGSWTSIRKFMDV